MKNSKIKSYYRQLNQALRLKNLKEIQRLRGLILTITREEARQTFRELQRYI